MSSIVISNNCLYFKTIVAQCEEDYELLNRCLNDSSEAGLRKEARINTWFRPKGDHVQPPMSDEEVRSRFYRLRSF